MLVLGRTVRIFALTRQVDVRAGADVLAQRVRRDVGIEPTSGAIFCFFNRKRTRVMLLVWDRNGYWMMAKRLERGSFERLDQRASHQELSREELIKLLSGIDTKTSMFRPHFPRDLRIQSRGGVARAGAT